MNTGNVMFALNERGQADGHAFQIGGSDDAPIFRPVAEVTAPSPPQLPVTVVPVAAPPSPVTPALVPASAETVMSTAKLLSQLRARLRVVEREIKIRSKLESERGQIKRLMSAAKQEQANVRRLRSAG